MEIKIEAMTSSDWPTVRSMDQAGTGDSEVEVCAATIATDTLALVVEDQPVHIVFATTETGDPCKPEVRQGLTHQR